MAAAQFSRHRDRGKLLVSEIGSEDGDGGGLYQSDEVGERPRRDAPCGTHGFGCHLGLVLINRKCREGARVGELDLSAVAVLQAVLEDMDRLVESAPGSLEGLQLVVSDIHAARSELVERGVEVSEVQEFPWGAFVFFSDPDGNK